MLTIVNGYQPFFRMIGQLKGVPHEKGEDRCLRPGRPKHRRWTRDDTELTLLGLPATIWFAVFCYLPMFGLIISFKDFTTGPRQRLLSQPVPE